VPFAQVTDLWPGGRSVHCTTASGDFVFADPNRDERQTRRDLDTEMERMASCLAYDGQGGAVRQEQLSSLELAGGAETEAQIAT
jgi:hypothetical protein